MSHSFWHRWNAITSYNGFFSPLSSFRGFGFFTIILLKHKQVPASITCGNLQYLKIIKVYLLHGKQRFCKNQTQCFYITNLLYYCNQGDASTEYSHMWEDTIRLKFPSYNWRWSILLPIPIHYAISQSLTA